MAKKIKTTTKSTNLFKNLSRNQKFIVITAIAIVGVFAIRLISAQSAKQNLSLNLPTASVALSLGEEKPMSITKDEAGNTIHESRGKSINVTTSGTIYCTPEDEGDIKVVQLSQEEVQKIISDVKSKNPASGATNANNIRTSVGNSKQLMLSNNGSTEVLVSEDSQSSEGLKQAEQILNAVCDTANQTVSDELVPEFTPQKDSKPTSSVGGRVSFIPKASAGGGSSGEAIEHDQINKINNERRARGLSTLGRSECLTVAARKWTNHMAKTNVLSHSSLIGPVENNCGTGWYKKIGENIGYGGDSASIFHAYMNSPSHRENILRPEYQRVGVGAMTYKHPSNPWVLVWTTQLFAQCKGACANK